MSTLNSGTTITRQLFRARVNAYALWGTGIALFAVIAGTLLVSVYQYGTVSAESVISVQGSNPALWLLNLMPFVFGLWGQLTGVMIMSRAGEMVMDQTYSLSSRTLELEQALRQSGSNRHQIRGLKNADQFTQILEDDIRKRGGCYDGIAVIALDFNQLRDARGFVNQDRLGAVIEMIAERLQRTLRNSDMLAHVHDDHFVIALYDVGASGNYLPRVCRRIHRALHAAMEVDDSNLTLEPRIGAALYPRDTGDGRALMDLAEAARRSSGRDAGSGVLTQVSRNEDDAERLTRAFSRAFDNDEMALDFAPQTGTTDGVLVYLRAGARWPGHEQALICDGMLADLAERSGRLHDYLLWLFDESFRSLRFWRERQDLMVGVCVPVPGAALGKLPVTQMLDDQLARYGLSPAGVVLEFSGQGLTAGGAEAEKELSRLRTRNYRFSLSGFGSTEASLQTLLHYRPDEVRLSPELIAELIQADDAPALAGLAKLATRLGAVVVMPGVTDMRLVKRLAGDEVQRLEGVVVGEAMPADRVGYWQQFGGQRRLGGVA